eukprot:1295233-Prymnesium_polylepis.1
MARVAGVATTSKRLDAWGATPMRAGGQRCQCRRPVTDLRRYLYLSSWCTHAHSTRAAWRLRALGSLSPACD